MRKALLLFALGLGLVAVAVAGVDFSGTWAFDAAKSDQGRGGGGGGRGFGGGDMTIKQTGNELTISRTFGENTIDTKYIMDGAEHSVETQGMMGGTMKYKAELSGSTLSITGTRTTQRGESPINQKYTLSEDGKSLTMVNVMNMGGQEMTMKQVYNKK